MPLPEKLTILKRAPKLDAGSTVTEHESSGDTGTGGGPATFPLPLQLSVRPESSNMAFPPSSIPQQSLKEGALFECKYQGHYLETNALTLAWHQAVLCGDIGEMDRLLRKNKELIRHRTNAGCSALYVAASKGNLRVCKFLVEHGAVIDDLNKRNMSPLMAAISMGTPQVEEFLIAAGADVDHVDSMGQSCLMYAVGKGRLNSVGALLRRDVEVNVRDKHGVAALSLALSSSRPDIVGALLHNGAAVTETELAECSEAEKHGWSGMAACCLLVEQSQRWTPETHFLFGKRFRKTILLLLLIQKALSGSEHQIACPPIELWFEVFSYLPRDSW